MIAEFLEPGDPRWTRALERMPHDVYHRPEYVLVAAAHEGGTPVAFFAETRRAALLIPLLLRRLPPDLGAPGEWCDATSPYGYPGPAAIDAADGTGLAECLVAFRECARERGLVSAFLRLHPMMSPPVGVLGVLGQVRPRGQVVLVDLTLSPEELWAQMRKDHRTEIRRLSLAGFTAAMDDWSAYPCFRSMYAASMRRVGATPFYFFNDAYFDGLRDRLAAWFHLCTVRAPDGSVAAAALFAADGGAVHYHLSATADEYRALAPSKLLLDFARRWARERGGRVLNLGGGRGAAADSLFRFKAGFSQSFATFRTLHAVVDTRRYAMLTERWQERSGGMDEGDGAFFPAYRRPLSAEPCQPASRSA